MRRVWRKIKDLWYGLFWGLKVTDEEVFSPAGLSQNTGTEITQQQHQNRLSTALLAGKETQQVRELRYRTYLVDREAKKYKYYSPLLAMKRDDKQDTKFIYYANEENLDVITIQPNFPIVEGVEQGLEQVGGRGKKTEYWITIERPFGFVPRYHIEQFTKRVVVRKRNDDDGVVVDLYVSKYPDDKDYLDEYRYAVVSAPSGHSIYSFGSAAHDGTPQTLLNNEEVLILAEHKGYSCVIVLSQKKARWVNTEYLTINEKCLILREKPCAEDLNTVDPGVSHPDTNEFLDAYEQKHVKTNQDLSGISCMRILAEGEKEGNYFKVEDGTEIVVLARNRYEFSCVLIPSMNAAGWIESRYLA